MTYCLIQKNEKNCNDCGEVIEGPYYTVDSGKVICEKDYKVSWYDIIVFQCDNVCSQKQVGKCGKCRRPAEGKILRVSEDVVYHPDCFTCSVKFIILSKDFYNQYGATSHVPFYLYHCQACNKNLINMKFNFDKEDSKLYCNEDYNRKHAAICYTCK